MRVRIGETQSSLCTLPEMRAKFDKLSTLKRSVKEQLREVRGMSDSKFQNLESEMRSFVEGKMRVLAAEIKTSAQLKLDEAEQRSDELNTKV